MENFGVSISAWAYSLQHWYCTDDVTQFLVFSLPNGVSGEASDQSLFNSSLFSSNIILHMITWTDPEQLLQAGTIRDRTTRSSPIFTYLLSLFFFCQIITVHTDNGNNLILTGIYFHVEQSITALSYLCSNQWSSTRCTLGVTASLI